MGETKKVFVDQLSPQDEVTSFFLVKEKQLRQKKSGEPFLSLLLSDRSGDINAVMWEEADTAAQSFEEGEIVKVQGMVGSYQKTLQITVQRLRKAAPEETDISDYIPAGSLDPHLLKKEIEDFIQTIENSFLSQLLENFFLDEEFYKKFSSAPGAKGLHHVYLGGLLEHTVSVTRLCKMICEHYPQLRRDLLISGALLHDLGKIQELRWDNRGFDYTDEGRLVGHIFLGLEMVRDRMQSLENFPADLAMELEHILISHHGQYEYGSPKRPKTLEALALHYADDLDAKMDIASRFMQQEREKGKGVWTDYHRVLERYLYLGKEEGEEEEIP